MKRSIITTLAPLLFLFSMQENSIAGEEKFCKVTFLYISGQDVPDDLDERISKSIADACDPGDILYF